MLYQISPEAMLDLQEQIDNNILLSSGEIVEPAHYEILVDHQPPRHAIEASPNLRALIYPFAGLPSYTRDLMREFPHITVHNSHHHAAPVAEMALTLLMAASRLLIPADRDLRKNDWTGRYLPFPTVTLHDKTALILGYGAIGQHLGKILKVMGMRVLGIRRTYADEANSIYTTEHLHDLLPQAQVLAVTLPGTKATENMITEHELALLPQNSIVVNIGRASIIDQHALYQALKSEYLHSAGLDVWYHYPADEESRKNTAPADVPFHELDNIVMSPHRAGAGRNLEIEQMRMKELARMLNMAAQGEALPNRVDLEQGY
jgi:phosphoglycerate dehydrogenase-like enzyme